MANQLLVRNIPEYMTKWIEQRRGENRMSQQEFVFGLLQRVCQAEESQKTPLFSTVQREIIEKPTPACIPFKFADLFAGIGGFRIALEKLGGNCVFSSEWDKYSQKTYKAWFGDTPNGDIRKIKPADIPEHDVLAAGFPCQPFSIAGVSKKNSLGQAHGFKCATQGNLFFYLASIIQVKRPPVLFLENVKNLLSHDGGRTWGVIKKTLEDLRYTVFYKTIDASRWVPQHRERIYIVCFDQKEFGDFPPFKFPALPDYKPRLSEILDPAPDGKYSLTNHLWNYLQKYAEKHRAKGNGFGFGLADPNGIARTLSARYYKDGSEILIPQKGAKGPRRLTPNECARLMGFDPERYRVVVSDTQAYRQFGNAVVPLVAEAVGQQILKVLAWQLTRKPNGCLIKSALSHAGSQARR